MSSILATCDAFCEAICEAVFAATGKFVGTIILMGIIQLAGIIIPTFIFACIVLVLALPFCIVACFCEAYDAIFKDHWYECWEKNVEEGQRWQPKGKLCQLKATMDPLLAAQIFNRQRCLILEKLPNELLFEIVDHLDLQDDVVSLYCLKLVCRRFNGLMSLRFGQKLKYERFSVLSPSRDIYTNRHPIAERLRRDGLCRECYTVYQRRHAALSWRWPDHDICAYGLYDPSQIFTDVRFCLGCRKRHRKRAFLDSGIEGGTCLGRRSGVWLCDHVEIWWNSIEGFLCEAIQKYYDQGRPVLGPAQWIPREAWRTILSSFLVECRHPSHATGCAQGIASWPTARLKLGQARILESSFHRLNVGSIRDDVDVMLSLEWSPHYAFSGAELGPGPAGDEERGRPRASAVRDMFSRHRLSHEASSIGVAERLFPSAGPMNAPVEMACFDTMRCRCLYYETGDCDNALATALLPCSEPSPKLCPVEQGGDTSDSECGHSFGRKTKDQARDIYSVSVSTHHGEWPQKALKEAEAGSGKEAEEHSRENKPYVCMVAHYRCNIPICSQARLNNVAKPADLRICPSHEWLHARNLRSNSGACLYQFDQHTLLYRCQNKTCANYVRGGLGTQICPWHVSNKETE